MCLIIFAKQVHPVYKLIVAANRDEFLQRPTAPIHYWEEPPDILAGRDLEKMGTWMGITATGRFAALTNYRDPLEVTEGKCSRGELVVDALEHKGNVKDYMQSLVEKKEVYPGYNLLAGDGTDLYYYSNKGQRIQNVGPGIYGISNHLLNTKWPKVQKGKEGMSKIINGEQDELIEKLLTMLQDTDHAPDELLPNTGVSFEWERTLSPLFIKSENYGTRSSTVMLMTGQEIQYVERVFSKEGISERQYTVKF
jgi:uncharacterized protein with NRDE domain